jgi:hypothetical protein
MNHMECDLLSSEKLSASVIRPLYSVVEFPHICIKICDALILSARGRKVQCMWVKNREID